MPMVNREGRGPTAQDARSAVFEHGRFSGPLHEQIRGLILSKIQDGIWAPGAPIPPEVQLARAFGVSIGTVRKALDQLARDRILIRERGRGTFVKARDGRRLGGGLRLCGPDGNAAALEIKLVDTDCAVATPSQMTALRMLRPAAIQPRALKLTREWRHSGVLVGLETITVDAARFPNLQYEMDPAAELLFGVYAAKYHAVVDHTAWTIKPLARGHASALQLTGNADATVMHCVRTAYDAKDMPLEIAEQIVLLHGDLALMANH